MTNDSFHTEKELLQQVAGGDEAAFGQLFHTWRDKLYSFILRITGSHGAAEDVVQDVFVKIWLHRQTLSTVDQFGAFLFHMAKNDAISGMRRLARETLILSELRRDTVDKGFPVDESLLYKQVQEKLKYIIDQLPPQQRLVYTLTREQGLRQEEVARQLHITVSTVQNHMTHALRTIRSQLRQYYSAGSIYLLIALEILLRK